MTALNETTQTLPQRLVYPYIDFDGRCEEALDFYQTTLGATIDCLMRYRDCPEPIDPEMIPPGNENKVMHAQFRIGASTLMASDCCCTGEASKLDIALSLTVESPEKAQEAFAALAVDGQIKMPLDKTFFAEIFGVVTDRFGISWMILANPISV